MYVGCQGFGTSRHELLFLVRHGVTHMDTTIDPDDFDLLRRSREEAAADAWFAGSAMLPGRRKPDDPIYDRARMRVWTKMQDDVVHPAIQKPTFNLLIKPVVSKMTDAELDDGEVVIDWLSKQEWASGSVGMFGISWGGTVAQQLARVEPDRCRKLVLAITSAGGIGSWAGTPLLSSGPAA